MSLTSLGVSGGLVREEWEHPWLGILPHWEGTFCYASAGTLTPAIPVGEELGREAKVEGALFVAFEKHPAGFVGAVRARDKRDHMYRDKSHPQRKQLCAELPVCPDWRSLAWSQAICRGVCGLHCSRISTAGNGKFN